MKKHRNTSTLAPLTPESVPTGDAGIIATLGRRIEHLEQQAKRRERRLTKLSIKVSALNQAFKLFGPLKPTGLVILGYDNSIQRLQPHERTEND